MAKLLVDDRDQSFVLYEMLEMGKLCNSPLFAEHSREVFDMVLSAAHKFAVSELVPTNKEGDEEGCTYEPETQTVKVPECYKAPFKMLGEGGWIASGPSVPPGTAPPWRRGSPAPPIFTSPRRPSRKNGRADSTSSFWVFRGTEQSLVSAPTGAGGRTTWSRRSTGMEEETCSWEGRRIPRRSPRKKSGTAPPSQAVSTGSS